MSVLPMTDAGVFIPIYLENLGLSKSFKVLFICKEQNSLRLLIVTTQEIFQRFPERSQK